MRMRLPTGLPVTIFRSSGRAEVDEVVGRIVRLNARYAAFSVNVAAHYDVIELRRVWRFAGVLCMIDEMRRACHSAV